MSIRLSNHIQWKRMDERRNVLVYKQIKGGFSDQFYDQPHLTNHTVAKII